MDLILWYAWGTEAGLPPRIRLSCQIEIWISSGTGDLAIFMTWESLSRMDLTVGEGVRTPGTCQQLWNVSL
jgi:hypothetical protein